MKELIIENLTKTYKNGVKALDDVNLRVGPGMFGLLGPNGAGKSSLMRTIATLQSPDRGSIRFGDIDVRENPQALRRTLGYLPQEFGVYPQVSAEDLLLYFAELKGISSKKERREIIDYVLRLTNLQAHRHHKVSGYSGGMKQRFGIAQMLLNNPSLIIVDEPTAGLDPAERQRFLNILREIGAEHTVIFSTHIVDDVRELCHQLAILNQGKVLFRGTAEEGTAELSGKIWTKAIDRVNFEAEDRNFTILSSHYNPDNTLQIRVYNDGLPNDTFIPATPSLEDLYFAKLKMGEADV